jgi:hypothetical protein
LALSTASNGAATLLEADPKGSAVEARFGVGASTGRLSQLFADSRGGFTAKTFQDVAYELPLGGAHDSRVKARVIMGHPPLRRYFPSPNVWTAMLEGLTGETGLAVAIVADLGRYDRTRNVDPLLVEAHRILIVTKPLLEDVAILRVGLKHLVETLLVTPERIQVACVGDRPHRPEEIALELGWGIPVVEIPLDEWAAGLLAGYPVGTAPWKRSGLHRAASALLNSSVNTGGRTP